MKKEIKENKKQINKLEFEKIVKFRQSISDIAEPLVDIKNNIVKFNEYFKRNKFCKGTLEYNLSKYLIELVDTLETFVPSFYKMLGHFDFYIEELLGRDIKTICLYISKGEQI